MRKEVMNEFLEKFHGNPPDSAEDVRRSLDEVHAGFPAEYVGFLQQSNGGEGMIGENYLILWKAEEIGPLNQAYEVAEYAPELILIGSSGGGEAIAFDTRKTPWNVVMVPFVGMDTDLALPVSDSFANLFSALFHDRHA